MREVAEAVRPAVKTSLAPTPVYPFQRFGTPPIKHVRLYAGNETRGRATLQERRPLLFLDLWAENEGELHEMLEAVDWLDGHMVVGQGAADGITYALNTATEPLEEPDGTLRIRATYNTNYYRVGA